ncbi:MAG: hypothetical protein J7K87_00605 [Candidatus Aenigmarchaeota archaeon]|nr:hypothetical protein [Candidatus Aenigmarchaeota archaeon]
MMNFSELYKKDFLEMIETLNGPFVYVNPHEFPDFSDNFSEDIQEIAYRIGKNDVGAVILPEENKIIIPPLPIEKTFEGDKNFLLEMINKKYTIGIILLRLGEYSIGIFEGNNLIVHKTGTQFVSGKIKAGGQSAARFQRVREGQINDFFKRVCSQIKEKFNPYEEKIEFIFFGGDSIVVKEFIEFCDYMKRFKERNIIMKRILSARHMKLKMLKNILKEVWKFRVYEF